MEKLYLGKTLGVFRHCAKDPKAGTPNVWSSAFRRFGGSAGMLRDGLGCARACKNLVTLTAAQGQHQGGNGYTQ